MTHHVHPWRRLRELGPDWKLVWSPHLPSDVYGYTDFAQQRIVLREGMSFAERRCSVFHEVEHVDHGEACDAAAELALNRRCAALMLPHMREIMDALIWHRGDHDAAADDLWVDPWTLDVRLSGLRGKEFDYYRERLADVILA